LFVYDYLLFIDAVYLHYHLTDSLVQNSYKMKKIILTTCIVFTAFISKSQMDIPPDGGNATAMVSEDIGITGITIKYHRPGVKGREGKIWGNVVPYGFNAFNMMAGKPASPWRAGANEATTISFEHDVKVEGKDLNAGTYALYMAIDKDTVTVIFSKETEAWGTFFYRPENDVLRVYVKPAMLDKSVERLKYEFIEQQEKSAVVTMQWEKLMVPFKVEVDVDNIVLKRIREQLIGPKGFASGNLVQIARYYYTKNTNLEEALGWAQRAVTGLPFGQSNYETTRTLAIGYEKLNLFLQADSVMNSILPFAIIAQYTGYGRSMISMKRFDRALEVMLGAQKKFGDKYAVNNGLSYAYSAKTDYTKALEFANKALAQASPQAKATVTANIEKLKAGKDINQ
jgi:hypothetical protein